MFDYNPNYNANVNSTGLSSFGDRLYSSWQEMFGAQQREERAYNERLAAQQLEWSNSAHQREVEDLKKAGLNPWLSAQGSGSSTPSISNESVSASGLAKDGASLLKTLAMTALAIIALG